jgi:dipeptidyl aminopeptidase/acylaminoacyl peptidase
MAEFGDRFASLARTRAPDLWREIEGREPRDPNEPSSPQRVVVALVAFLVAIAGIGIAAVTFGGSDRPAAAAGGRIAFAAVDGSTWQIYSVAPDGSGLVQLTHLSDMEVASAPAWSPDGGRVAFVVQTFDETGGTRRADIWTMDADGSDPTQVTHGPGSSWSPSWSPDGTQIAYTRVSAHQRDQIWIMDSDGSDPYAFTHCGSECLGDSSPSWSPDGTRIAFVRRTGSGAVIPWSVNVWPVRDPRSLPVPHIELDGATFAAGLSWSPDGSILALDTDLDGAGLYVVDVEEERIRLVTKGPALDPSASSWSPDGNHIVFSGTPPGSESSTLYVADADGTNLRELTGLPPNASWPAWQPTPTETQPEPPPPPTDAGVVDTFTVGPDVRSVVFGEGSVWVATSNNDGSEGGRILRIDPETHEVQAEIPVEVIPTWEVGGGAMVVEEGSLWVTGAIEGPGTDGVSDAAVIRIDTSTNEVAQTFDLGGHVGADLTFLDGDLWVLLFGDDGMEVVRVDRETGRLIARFQVAGNWAHTLVATDGRLITAVGGDDAVNVDGRMIQIDPATGVVSQIDVPTRSFTPMPVLSRGEVWVSLDPGFTRFAPLAQGFPDPSVELELRFSDCCGFLEGDDRGIWFLSLAPNGTDPTLNLFDPATGDAAGLVELDQGSPVAMAVAPDAVWILNYEGTLTHVRLG